MAGPVSPSVSWFALMSVFTVLWIGSPDPARATPTVTQEPYKLEAGGSRSDLSTDPADPTVFTWSEDERILWWAFSTTAENGIPASEWHVRPLPAGEVIDNSWFVVTGSDACRESSAGTASDGTLRTASGTWSTCGPVP